MSLQSRGQANPVEFVFLWSVVNEFSSLSSKKVALVASGHEFDPGSEWTKLIEPSRADKVSKLWTKCVVLILSTGAKKNSFHERLARD